MKWNNEPMKYTVLYFTWTLEQIVHHIRAGKCYVTMGLNSLVTLIWNKQRCKRYYHVSTFFKFVCIEEEKMPIILYFLVFRLTQSLQPQLRLSSWLEVTQSAKSLFALVIWSVPRWCELLTSTTTIELFKLWLSSRTNRVSCRIICSVVINRKLRVEFNILNIVLKLP